MYLYFYELSVHIVETQGGPFQGRIRSVNRKDNISIDSSMLDWDSEGVFWIHDISSSENTSLVQKNPFWIFDVNLLSLKIAYKCNRAGLNRLYFYRLLSTFSPLSQEMFCQETANRKMRSKCRKVTSSPKGGCKKHVGFLFGGWHLQCIYLIL